MAGQSRASVYVYDLDTPSKARLVVNNVSLSGPVAITVPNSWYDAHGQVNVVAWAKVGNKMPVDHHGLPRPDGSGLDAVLGRWLG
ncbi:MAG: hypothetical protein ACR2FF_00745 [Mycobacteriales bacterium]|nr:MAG: hypothetical protein DLM56_02885 [Pseudonocardiales bacterium]